MKLENLLLSGDSIKISDFGAAICLDSEMKLPFAYGMHVAYKFDRLIE